MQIIYGKTAIFGYMGDIQINKLVIAISPFNYDFIRQISVANIMFSKGLNIGRISAIIRVKLMNDYDFYNDFVSKNSKEIDYFEKRLREYLTWEKGDEAFNDEIMFLKDNMFNMLHVSQIDEKRLEENKIILDKLYGDARDEIKYILNRKEGIIKQSFQHLGIPSDPKEADKKGYDNFQHYTFNFTNTEVFMCEHKGKSVWICNIE